MTAPERFDAIVIGTGQAGKPLATALGRAGWQVAIIEREHVGGSCVNVGCTPTKTMVASARVAHLARRAADYGVVFAGPPSVDQEVVRDRKRAIVDSFSRGNRKGLDNVESVELIMGEASFLASDKVAVALNEGGRRELTAERIFINTGARPLVPDIPGLHDVPWLDSTSIMELDQVPAHLVVMGGGYIGLEFAQMFRRFGSRVTLIQRGSQLLTREDEDVAAAVLAILEEDGMDVLLDTHVRQVGPGRDGVDVTVEGGDGVRRITGSHLFLATGRTPNTASLDPAAAGVTTDARGFIPVDDRLETNVPGIFALGDVNGGPAFTHVSYDDFRVLRANLLDGADVSTRGRMVPYAVFIDPQLGRVGLSEKEARAQGLEIQVAKLPMDHVARALEMDETRGFMKAVVDARTERILGATILGIEGGEIMSMLQIAMMGGLPYTALRDAVFAHPTLAESLNNLFMTIGR